MPGGVKQDTAHLCLEAKADITEELASQDSFQGYFSAEDHTSESFPYVSSHSRPADSY